jgi:predicted DNA-binding mobile mystery protein A
MREALGMGIESFAKRLGISRQAAYKLESAEESGSITLKRLRSAADAVDCDVAVFLIPRKPLEKIVEEQATSTAYHLVARVGHSMALEAQGLPPGQLANMVRETAKEMIQRGDPKIWE